MTTALVEVLGTCWTASVASSVSSMFNKETLSPEPGWRTIEDSQCLSLHIYMCTCRQVHQHTHVHTCIHPPTPDPEELFGFCYLEPETKESGTLEMSPLSICVFSRVETPGWGSVPPTVGGLAGVLRRKSASWVWSTVGFLLPCWQIALSKQIFSYTWTHMVGSFETPKNKSIFSISWGRWGEASKIFVATNRDSELQMRSLLLLGSHLLV